MGLKLGGQETMEGILSASDMKWKDFALVARQNLSVAGEELLQSRGEVNDEKRASGGEERRKVWENNGEGEDSRDEKRRSWQERES